jgi:biopolymer transport protein ExbD
LRIKRPDDEPADVNMTPMIDMVFNLLIFFLVATRFADIERDVRVHPPMSRSARPITATPQELVVNVTREGRFMVAGRLRSIDEIDGLLAAAVKENPRQSVVIRGDRDAILQHAVDILDRCERHNIERTYLTTRKTGP